MRIPKTIQQGQTLVILLVFMIIAVTITAAATAVILMNTSSTSKFEQGVIAYGVAESGAENAILRLLRNPSYSGETLSVGEGTAVITVTGTDPKTITSQGRVRNYVRTIRVVAGYTNNILTVSSWSEI